MNAFVSMREYISQNNQMLHRVNLIENKQILANQKLLTHDENFEKVFQAIENHKIIPKQGVFYDGQIFDAYKFILELILETKQKIILIDNFVDETTLTILSNKKQEVKLEIYTKNISNKLKLSLEKFNQQYQLLEIYEFNKSHDRFLIIDKDIYVFGASIKC